MEQRLAHLQMVVDVLGRTLRHTVHGDVIVDGLQLVLRLGPAVVFVGVLTHAASGARGHPRGQLHLGPGVLRIHHMVQKNEPQPCLNGRFSVVILGQIGIGSQALPKVIKASQRLGVGQVAPDVDDGQLTAGVLEMLFDLVQSHHEVGVLFEEVLNVEGGLQPDGVETRDGRDRHGHHQYQLPSSGQQEQRWDQPGTLPGLRRFVGFGGVVRDRVFGPKTPRLQSHIGQRDRQTKYHEGRQGGQRRPDAKTDHRLDAGRGVGQDGD